jgi:hypothetical protein
MTSSNLRRQPTWSTALTRPAGGIIPPGARPATLAAIKAIHTVLFVSIGTAIAVFLWDGIRGDPSRRAAYALGVALGEAGIYVSNNQVCPLTPLAEELGAQRGAVVDMFLPGWAARRIPMVSTLALVVGAALHARALMSDSGASD